MQPMFSVIVPFFNSEKYLAECIQSVLSQSYESFELLLIDDGSTDLSSEIAMAYVESDSRIVYVWEKNSGVATARNLGIKSATGEHIVFLDSDDLLASQALLVLGGVFQLEQPNMVVCSRYYEFSGTQEKEIVLFDSKTLDVAQTLTDRKALCQSLSSMCIGVYRNSFVQQSRLYVREKISMGEDTDFFFRALINAKSLTIAECALFKYRSNPESVSNNLKYEQIRDVMIICGIHLKNLNSGQNYDLDIPKAKDFFATKYIHFAIKISKLKGNKRNALCNQLFKDRKLLRGARGKPETIFVMMLESVGADITVSVFAILLLFRNIIRGY